VLLSLIDNDPEIVFGTLRKIAERNSASGAIDAG
jgi:hypothetical protein